MGEVLHTREQAHCLETLEEKILSTVTLCYTQQKYPTNETINLCILGDIRVHQQTPLYLQKDEIKLSVLEGCINIYLVILLCAFEMEAVAVPGNLISQQNTDGDSLSCPSFAQRPFF